VPPIVASAEVNRPAKDVFAYATDPTHFSEWQSGVVSGRMDDDGRPAVGAHCITVRRIGGAERASTSKLAHLDPPRTWGVRGIDGPIRAAVDVTVEPVDDARSRIEIAVDFEGHGIGRMLVPLVVRREAAKEMPANLARLKERLESGRV
jgi:carbon monoxide dehydrogenase subunit G